jgi:MFS transporter, NRE family, putaive nickel resistance protein
VAGVAEPAAGTAAERLSANRNFLRLFAAQVTSLVGSGVTSIALAAFAYELSGRNATVVVGTALTLRILAFVLLSPIAGVLADRIDRKRMLVAADLIRAALLGVFPFITTVGQIYLLIFAINAVTAFFTPAFEAAIPEVVGPRMYTRAVSWSRIALALEAAGGPLVAGLFIALIGVHWTFWVDGATYLISAALVLGSRVPRAPKPTAGFPWSNFVTQITHGTRVLLREPALRKALLLHMAEATAGAVAIVATVVYVREVLGLGDVAFSLAMAAVGVGSAVVALLLPGRAEAARAAGSGALEEHLRYHRWAERSLLLGGVALTLSLLPGALVPGIVLLGVLWAVNGAGQALVAIPSVGLLAEHTQPDERGQAYAAHFALTHLFWLGSYPAVGYLAFRIGTPLTFTAAGVVCALLVALAASIRRPHRPHELPAA